jgi:serralysin
MLVTVLALVALLGICGCNPSLAKPGGSRIGASVSLVTGVAHPPCTIYAAPNGKPWESGRTAAAATTVFAAVRRAGPGSVVCLEPGVYQTNTNVTVQNSGRHGKPITITGDRGRATIQYTGGLLDGGVVQTTYCKPWCASHDIVFENLTLNGGNKMNAGVFVREGARYVTIRDCVILNTGSAGITMNAVDHVRAQHNLVYHTGYGQGWASGIVLWYGGIKPVYGGPRPAVDNASGFHNYIVDNVVAGAFDNSGFHSDGNGIIIDGGVHVPPALIANNIVYENGAAGISTYRVQGSVWVINNTTYANALDQLVGHGKGWAGNIQALFSTGIHWVNNIAYGRVGRTFYYAFTYNNTHSSISWVRNVGFNGKPLSVAHSITGNSAMYRYVDPKFIGVPRIPGGSAPYSAATAPWNLGNDFLLRFRSPALNWGVNPSRVRGLPRVMRNEIARELSIRK